MTASGEVAGIEGCEALDGPPIASARVRVTACSEPGHLIVSAPSPPPRRMVPRFGSTWNTGRRAAVAGLCRVCGFAVLSTRCFFLANNLILRHFPPNQFPRAREAAYRTLQNPAEPCRTLHPLQAQSPCPASLFALGLLIGG